MHSHSLGHLGSSQENIRQPFLPPPSTYGLEQQDFLPHLPRVDPARGFSSPALSFPPALLPPPSSRPSFHSVPGVVPVHRKGWCSLGCRGTAWHHCRALAVRSPLSQRAAPMSSLQVGVRAGLPGAVRKRQPSVPVLSLGILTLLQKHRLSL